MLLLFTVWPGFLSEFANKIKSWSVFKFVFLLVFLMPYGKNSQQVWCDGQSILPCNQSKYSGKNEGPWGAEYHAWQV